MIWLTRLSHVPVVLNSDLIEYIDTTPDTVITLTTGQKMMVLEAAQEVVERVIRFRRAVGGAVHRSATDQAEEGTSSPEARWEANGS